MALEGCAQIRHVSFGPSAHPRKQNDREQSRKGEPGDAGLAPWQHNHGREQRPQSESGIAPELKERLRQTVLPS